MLRSSLPRALPSSMISRYSLQRSSPIFQSRLLEPQRQPARFASAQHAISNPTLAGIEKRWERMPPQEQAELWMQLRDRMKVDWHDMTMQEKKAAYWVSFGPHGPRAMMAPGTWWMIIRHSAIAVLISLALFAVTRYFARPAPHTMTQEYQEMTNEYLRGQNVEPISGLSSEGYKGKGMVQSKPAKFVRHTDPEEE